MALYHSQTRHHVIKGLISCNITFELFDKVDVIIKSSLEDYLRFIHFPPPFCTHGVSVMSETKSQLW